VATSKERSDKPAGGAQEEEQVGFNIVSIRMDEGLKIHSFGIQQRKQQTSSPRTCPDDPQATPTEKAMRMTTAAHVYNTFPLSPGMAGA
jgi:hypothetical protein